MSARGRKRADGEEIAKPSNENYPTPAWVVHRLIEAVHLPRGRWLEPCAGEGAIVRAVNEKRGDVVWTACEIRSEARRSLVEAVSMPTPAIAMERPSVQIGDFFEIAPARWPSPRTSFPFDVAITNPAFTLTERFVREMQTLAPIVAILQKVTFLASDSRQPWLASWMPDEHVLPNRPDFTGTGGDMIEYAWFVWYTDRRGPLGRVSVLATTPKEIRKPKREKVPA